jgi:MFS family permease
MGGCLIFAWPFAQNLGSLIAFTLIYGFFSGAFISLPPSTIGSVTHDMAQFGAKLGLAVTINGLGLLVGPPVAGVIIGSRGGYIAGAAFAGSIVCLGSLLLFLQICIKSSR